MHTDCGILWNLDMDMLSILGWQINSSGKSISSRLHSQRKKKMEVLKDADYYILHKINNCIAISIQLFSAHIVIEDKNDCRKIYFEWSERSILVSILVDNYSNAQTGFSMLSSLLRITIVPS